MRTECQLVTWPTATRKYRRRGWVVGLPRRQILFPVRAARNTATRPATDLDALVLHSLIRRAVSNAATDDDDDTRSCYKARFVARRLFVRSISVLKLHAERKTTTFSRLWLCCRTGVKTSDVLYTLFVFPLFGSVVRRWLICRIAGSGGSDKSHYHRIIKGEFVEDDDRWKVYRRGILQREVVKRGRRVGKRIGLGKKNLRRSARPYIWLSHTWKAL